MIWYLVRRLLSAVILIVVISFLALALTRAIPGDPARQILGVGASEAQVTEKRTELGLDRSLPSTYLDWLRHAVTGDFGTSWYGHRSVAETIASRLPVTLSITLVATLLSGAIGIALGMAAAARRGALDSVLQPVSVLGFALPNFVLAVILVSIVAVHLRLLPATGYVPPDESLGGWLRSIALPVIALALGATAAVAQQTRNACIEILQSEWVRTLRSRGVPTWRFYLRHVLRNAAPVALTVMTLQFVGLLSGAVVIESLFALPGLGELAIGASEQKDQPVILAVVVAMVVAVVIVNLLVDLAYGWLNPKVRAS